MQIILHYKISIVFTETGSEINQQTMASTYASSRDENNSDFDEGDSFDCDEIEPHATDEGNLYLYY